MALPSGVWRSRPLTVVLATALVGAGIACAPLETFVVDGDDDRPPIIVSSGSVTITAEPDPKYNYRGFFDVEDAGSRWKHQHPNAATVALEVSVTGSSACTTTTRTTGVEIKFDVGGQHKKLTFDIDRGDLRIKSNGAPFTRLLGDPHILKNDAATMTSVEIDGGPECTFDSATRRVKIEQRHR